MTKKDKLNYSILSLSLSFVGLPIYINVSDFYIRNYNLNISYFALVLMLVRLIDSFQEPFLGLFSTTLIKKNISHKKIIYVSSFFLALSFFALFNPPNFLEKNMILCWVILAMFFTYTFYNLTIINFESLAVIIAKNSAERVDINSQKEFFGLCGIIIASVSPTLIGKFVKNDKEAYFYLSLFFVIMLFLSILIFFRKVNDKHQGNQENLDCAKSSIKDFLTTNLGEIIKNKIFITLMLIILINSIAVSFPASMITFFVKDFLKAPEELGFFLLVYFISAGIFMNFWRIIANKYGKVNCWYLSILGSVITFIFAYFIDSSNYQFFYFICFFSGVFLGADLMMPPILIAEIIAMKKDKISSYISIWNMVNKFGLMLASFFSLMALSSVSFNIESLNYESMNLIPAIYALVPCVLKLGVFILLIKSKNLKNL